MLLLLLLLLGIRLLLILIRAFICTYTTSAAYKTYRSVELWKKNSLHFILLYYDLLVAHIWEILMQGSSALLTGHRALHSP
jgi:hypothetical protein